MYQESIHVSICQYLYTAIHQIIRMATPDNHKYTDQVKDKVILNCDPQGNLGIFGWTASAGVLLQVSRQYQIDITQ